MGTLRSRILISTLGIATASMIGCRSPSGINVGSGGSSISALGGTSINAGEIEGVTIQGCDNLIIEGGDAEGLGHIFDQNKRQMANTAQIVGTRSGASCQYDSDIHLQVGKFYYVSTGLKYKGQNVPQVDYTTANCVKRSADPQEKDAIRSLKNKTRGTDQIKSKFESTGTIKVMVCGSKANSGTLESVAVDFNVEITVEE